MCGREQRWFMLIYHSCHNPGMTSVTSDSEQAACQHAISPPFGHSNTQGRVGHYCSPGGLLAPTWPRRSSNTPTALTIQRLKSSILVSPDTPHWGTKGKRRRWRRLSLAHQVNESGYKREGKVEEEKVFCSVAASREADTKCSMKQKIQTEPKGWVLYFLGRAKMVCFQSDTHELKDTRTCTPLLLHTYINISHTPSYVKPFHLVHLYVHHPSLSKQLCVFACKRQSERGIKMKGACMYALEREKERWALSRAVCVIKH